MRRSTTEAWTKWVGLVSEQSESGQSVAAFCRERGLRAWHFYEWKKRVRESEAAKFVEVEIDRQSLCGRRGHEAARLRFV